MSRSAARSSRGQPKHKAGLDDTSIFEKILNDTYPADVLYGDDLCIVFRDIAVPNFAPVHFIVLPRKMITSLESVGQEDKQLLGHMMYVAKEVASKENLSFGYRIVINVGADATAATRYLHLHVFGGRRMNWPPG